MDLFKSDTKDKVDFWKSEKEILEKAIISNIVFNVDFFNTYKKQLSILSFKDEYKLFLENVSKIQKKLKRNIEKVDLQYSLDKFSLNLFNAIEKQNDVYLDDKFCQNNETFEDLISKLFNCNKKILYFDKLIYVHDVNLDWDEFYWKHIHLLDEIHSEFPSFEHQVKQKTELIETFKKNQKKLDQVFKKTGLIGIKTGFEHLDVLLKGYQNKKLILIAGRSGMGKTSFLLKSMMQCLYSEKHFLFFTVEMAADELMERVFLRFAKLESLFCKTLTEEQEKQKKIEEFERLLIPKFHDSGIVEDVVEIDQLVQVAKQANKKKKLDCIFVDYLQILKFNTEKTQSREREISEISIRLKNLAKDLDVPVVVGCQLNRDVEKLADKRPLLSHLRESGSLEQDADVVIMLFDPRQYDKITKDLYELIVTKHRQGRKDTLKVPYFF